MKPACVFLLLTGLVLVAANGDAFEEPQAIELNSSDDYIDFEAFGAIGILKTALRSVKALHCTIQAAINMKNAAQQFLNDVQNCGAQATAQVTNLIKACNAVVVTSNNIINLNENVCNNGGDTTDSGKVSNSCFVKFLNQMLKLRKQVKNVVALTKKVPTAGPNANTCVSNAVNNLAMPFTNFPNFIADCSKLTS